MSAVGPGAFVAVVGASGVGKDALIGYARARLDGAVLFPRRVITRPTGRGEDFESVDEAGFAQARDAGAFAIWWRAHGLGYGIPASVDEHLSAGGVVVANVSRAVLDALAGRYARLLVVRVTVPEEVRAERLHRRGREQAEDVAARLARPDPAPDFPVDAQISNDGTLAEGGELLLRVVSDALRGAGAR